MYKNDIKRTTRFDWLRLDDVVDLDWRKENSFSKRTEKRGVVGWLVTQFFQMIGWLVTQFFQLIGWLVGW